MFHHVSSFFILASGMSLACMQCPPLDSRLPRNLMQCAVIASPFTLLSCREGWNHFRKILRSQFTHTHTTHWIGTGTKMLRKNWSCGYWGSIATVTKLVSSFTRWSHANLSILRGCFLIFCNLKNIFCSAQHLFPSSDSIRPKHSPSRTCKETRLFRSFSYFFNLPKSTKYLRHTFPREKPISHTSFTSWPTLA